MTSAGGEIKRDTRALWVVMATMPVIAKAQKTSKPMRSTCLFHASFTTTDRKAGPAAARRAHTGSIHLE